MRNSVGGLMRRRGQLALIAILTLAATLIVLTSLRTPQPYVAYERGHLQAAQLIHLARVCLSETCDCSRLNSLLSTLVSLNGTEPLRMYPTFSPCALDNPLNRTVRGGRGWLTEYRVEFAIWTPAGLERVVLAVAIENLGSEGVYTKTVWEGGQARVYTMVKVRLKYVSSCTTPFFNATTCPRLTDPRGLADLPPGPGTGCEWLVGIPVEEATPLPPSVVSAATHRYTLRDEQRIAVPVYFGV